MKEELIQKHYNKLKNLKQYKEISKEELLRLAEKKANELGNRLVALGVNIDLIEIDAEDPAELSDLQAQRLMKIIR